MASGKDKEMKGGDCILALIIGAIMAFLFLMILGTIPAYPKAEEGVFKHRPLNKYELRKQSRMTVIGVTYSGKRVRL